MMVEKEIRAWLKELEDQNKTVTKITNGYESIWSLRDNYAAAKALKVVLGILPKEEFEKIHRVPDSHTVSIKADNPICTTASVESIEKGELLHVDSSYDPSEVDRL